MFSLISNGITGECIPRAVYCPFKESAQTTGNSLRMRNSMLGSVGLAAFIGSIFAYSIFKN